MSNKSAKERLIKLYGPECFIEKLKLRDTSNLKYTGRKQYERMKQLTYHHILEKRNGGRATVENGALLSFENHMWFNKQDRQSQTKMNNMFKAYKECKVILDNDIPMDYVVQLAELEVTNNGIKIKKADLDKQRRREKRQLQKIKKDYEDR